MRKALLSRSDSQKPTLRSGALPEFSPALGGSSLDWGRGEACKPALDSWNRAHCRSEACTLRAKACLRDVALSKTGRNQGLSGAGRSTCARTWSFLELNVPGTGKGSKQRSRSCLCLCSPGQPRPGLDKTSSTQARRACLHH